MSWSESLNPDNIQGDILSGFPKKTEIFFFFQIHDVAVFRKQLADFVPLVKTVAQILRDRETIRDHKRSNNKELVAMVGVNIAFSHKGFNKLGIDDSNLTNNDENFKSGQEADAELLGDSATSGTLDWDPAFLQDIHGVILIAGESRPTVHDKLTQVERIFGIGSSHASIKKVKSIFGDVRPDELSAHEHFGFLDGISNPAIIGFDKDPPPGPRPVQPGVILLGHSGDPQASSRPKWVVDGSFLVFRYLSQKVPEFNTYLETHPVLADGAVDGSELLGARLVGRWKSGTPVVLAPLKDDPEIARDPNRNNNFLFSNEGNAQGKCPFAAHIRKTNPRDDLTSRGVDIDLNRIMRRGIAFGPEVTIREKESGRTDRDRGLLFVCYQTSINKGFAFQQKSWSNNPNFPPEATPQVPGLDPIVGQGNIIKLSGVHPDDPGQEAVLPKFVVPKGGEYFFSPSLEALRETLAA